MSYIVPRNLAQEIEKQELLVKRTKKNAISISIAISLIVILAAFIGMTMSQRRGNSFLEKLQSNSKAIGIITGTAGILMVLSSIGFSTSLIIKEKIKSTILKNIIPSYEALRKAADFKTLLYAFGDSPEEQLNALEKFDFLTLTTEEKTLVMSKLKEHARLTRSVYQTQRNVQGNINARASEPRSDYAYWTAQVEYAKRRLCHCQSLLKQFYSSQAGASLTTMVQSKLHFPIISEDDPFLPTGSENLRTFHRRERESA